MSGWADDESSIGDSPDDASEPSPSSDPDRSSDPGDDVDRWDDVDDRDARLDGRFEVVPEAFGEVSLPPGSALYVGHVTHRRLRPRRRRLEHRVWYLLADVDDLWRLDEKIDGFRHNRRARVEFRDADHFGPTERSVRGKLAEFLASRGHQLPDGRVLVLAHPRVLGHVANPVSFWFCHGPEGRLELVVAEVDDASGDRHGYVLHDLEDLGDERVRAEVDEFVHVSPFLPFAGHRHRFTIRRPTAEPGSTLAVQLEVFDGAGEHVLDATVSLHRVELTSASLRRVLRRDPLVTVRTMLRVRWHVLRIRLRHVGRSGRRAEHLPDDGPRDGEGRRVA